MSECRTDPDLKQLAAIENDDDALMPFVGRWSNDDSHLLFKKCYWAHELLAGAVEELGLSKSRTESTVCPTLIYYFSSSTSPDSLFAAMLLKWYFLNWRLSPHEGSLHIVSRWKSNINYKSECATFDCKICFKCIGGIEWNCTHKMQLWIQR